MVLLWPADGGAASDRVRVWQPAGVQDVDQRRRAPPRHRRRTEVPSLTAAVGACAVAVIHRSPARNHVDIARQGSHVEAAVREMKSQVICSDADVTCSSHLLEKIAH